MGVSIAWIAVKGRTKDEVLSELGMQDAGEETEPWHRGKVSITELPTGWTMVFAGNCEFAKPKLAMTLSAGGEAVTCAVEEHVSFASAAGFRDGQQVWSIVRDPDKNGEEVVIEGTLPNALRDLELRPADASGDDEGSEWDDPDLPIEAARILTGYRYDGIGVEWERDLIFTVLQRARGSKAPAADKPKGKGFFSRLFGG